MSKVIVLDFGIFMHRSIFASVNNPDIPPTYTCLSMILGCLRRIGLDPQDTIIVAMDYLRSWRRELEPSYKADRVKKREESLIDFKEEYRKFNELIEQLDTATKWHWIKIPHLESDDILAVACRVFHDREVILVTYDSDLEQCWSYSHVKIFSPLKKSYKIKPDNFNVYKLISKKVKKETSDNLTSPILNERDYETRLTCVNLLELPSWVEQAVREKLENLEEKAEYLEKIPFQNIRQRFGALYNDKSRVLSYENCVRREERKRDKGKKLKAKEMKNGCAINTVV